MKLASTTRIFYLYLRIFILYKFSLIFSFTSRRTLAADQYIRVENLIII